MKRYFQILLMVMCVMAFGAKIKAQEQQTGTHYHNLVYNNLIVTQEGLDTLKDLMKTFIDIPHPYDEVFSKENALRYGYMAGQTCDVQ